MRLVEDIPPEQVGVALTEDSVLCPLCWGARLVHPVNSGAVMVPYMVAPHWCYYYSLHLLPIDLLQAATEK